MCAKAYEAEAAAAWASLPFYKARVEEDEILSRVVVQRLSPTLTAVVLHSTHAFSSGVAHVYGATSTAARLAGAASDKEQEKQVLEAMLSAAASRLGPMLGESAAASVHSPAWGPHLHRWGAAFPDAPLLPESEALVQQRAEQERRREEEEAARRRRQQAALEAPPPAILAAPVLDLAPAGFDFMMQGHAPPQRAALQ